MLLQQLEALFGGACGGGKGQYVADSAVLTPWGFKPIGGLEVGSAVCATDGTVTRVIGVYPRGVQDLYKLTWADGSVTTCDEDHIWLAWKGGSSRKIANSRVGGEASARKWTVREIYAKYCSGSATLRIPNISKPCLFNVHGENCGPGKHISRSIHPYLLGLLLGDGYLSKSTVLHTADSEIIDRVSEILGERIEPHPSSVQQTAPSYPLGRFVAEHLANLGLVGKTSADKFIPRIYKLASVEERWELLRGLMDSDGWSEEDGDCYYTSVSKDLMEDVRFVARSLGAVVTLRTGYPTYKYKDEIRTGKLAYTLRIKIHDPERLFHLGRKKERCAGKQYQFHGLKLVSIEKAGRGETVCIQVAHPNSLYITDDFIVTHNTDSILMSSLQHVDIPGYAALILRRTFTQLAKSDGPVQRSREWLSGTDALYSEKSSTWTFPSGARIEFGHMQYEHNKFDFQSAAYQFIGFDQVEQFTETQYRYLLSRLRRRSDSDVPLRVRCAANPGGFEWVKRRFVDEGRANGRPFIPAKLKDNPFLDRESYEATLQNLDPVTRSQLLDGDWSARLLGGMFKHEWFGEVLPFAPDGLRLIRSWDLAHSKPKKGQDPDWTVGLKYGVRNGQYFILHVDRFRGTPHEVEERVKRVANLDGVSVPIVMEQEPAGGKALIAHYQKDVLMGFAFKGVPAPSKDPTIRYGPISSACEGGLVYLVQGGWITEFVDEIEAAPNSNHDDQLTAWAAAHVQMATSVANPQFY